jgi:hypothetical protein
MGIAKVKEEQTISVGKQIDDNEEDFERDTL